MGNTTIGLIAAMPDEIRPLLKKAGKYEKMSLGGVPLYQFRVAGNRCLLLESGIGIRRAERAAETLLASERVDVMISFGFGGAVKPGMSAGDLAIARRSILYGGRHSSCAESAVFPLPRDMWLAVESIGAKNGFKVVEGDFLTADTILDKKALRGTLPRDMTNPVLDMETWAVAQAAARRSTPLLAIRAVSDAADEDLGFSLDQFSDSEMNIRISRILRAIARKPRIIPQLIRLARNAGIAGRNLASAIMVLAASDYDFPPDTGEWGKSCRCSDNSSLL
ncbi:MAG: methylthioadenosine nucleosidase [Geobacteraceae bacterium]|nr:methylthioadenosine nucleosidase [Geobacteraceae bacterium]